ncbi:MAG: hypothetical protein K2K70_04605 [Lachnospiraceae bacterium]|nr:hypothetical protein [Lachnospiraceae bacterium]
MDNKIKKAYSNIKMTEDSKEKVYRQILETTDDDQDQKRGLGSRKVVLSGWKMGIAACLAAALIIPTGAYAAGKLSKYINIKVEKNNYHAKLKLEQTKDTDDTKTKDKETMHYIQVQTDCGPDYKMEQVTYDMNDGEEINYYEYIHKDGSHAGKDFSCEILYVDKNSDTILDLYNQESMQEIEINGHRALFCENGTVHGSQYHYDTDYTLNVYVFYEEYGYIISYTCMQGLGKEQLISMAEKTTVTDVAKKDASGYTLLSNLQNSNTKPFEPISDSTEVTSLVKEKNEVLKCFGLSLQVLDVKVSSKVADYDTTDPKQELFLDHCQNMWDKNGKLKPYIREEIKCGDGISEPEMSVIKKEKIQPKMVYVTLKATGSALLQLPDMEFFEKKDNKYYDMREYLKYKYNRPEEIIMPYVDRSPCYFKETVGGEQYIIKNLQDDGEHILHFAYIVDEDMLDSMYLCFNSGYSKDQRAYIDISQ